MILLLNKLGQPVPLKTHINNRDREWAEAIDHGWAIARCELAPQIPGALEYLNEAHRFDGSTGGGAMRGRKVRARRAGRHLRWGCI